MRLWTKAPLRNATRLLFTGKEKNCSVGLLFGFFKLVILKDTGRSYILIFNYSKSATFRIYLTK